MREKYIEERFPRWFIFGESVLTCDVSDGDRDVAVSVSKATALAMIEARDAYVASMVKIFMADPDALYKLPPQRR